MDYIYAYIILSYLETMKWNTFIFHIKETSLNPQMYDF